jgi:hypothetical protein
MPEATPPTDEDGQEIREQASRVWAHAMHEDDKYAQYGPPKALMTTWYLRRLASYGWLLRR